MSAPSPEAEIAVLKEQHKQMEEHIKATDARVAKLADDKEKALIAGIVFLGSGLITVVTFVFSYLKDHFR